MIAAGLIVSTTLLLVFAPIVLTWIVGIGAALLVGAAILRFVDWLFGGMAGDVAGAVQMARGQPGEPRLPWRGAAKTLAIIFGPITLAQIGSYFLPVGVSEGAWAIVILAYPFAIGPWLWIEYRKARVP